MLHRSSAHLEPLPRNNPSPETASATSILIWTRFTALARDDDDDDDDASRSLNQFVVHFPVRRPLPSNED
ncbi:hypothetical protein GUJ93_ZPchr0007g5656 [Zizania palustris]|uniref:Uncharacterized protein n=1 Tax=Zizania palustris TaxID=103762 RepID=A0A8J5VY42_ZIZPA|nr:hypothetical protein GUJ93_ZPchr0007g5656 [Zizania palustris]